MSDNKNKFEGNSRYFTICIYSTVTVLIMAIIIRAVFFWELPFLLALLFLG